MRTDEHVEKLYFEWLCGLIDEDPWKSPYMMLLLYLQKIEFYWTIRMDENRAADAKHLRVEFFNMYPNFAQEEKDLLNGEQPTMLEVTIALAQRLDFMMYDPDIGVETEQWFWEILSNVGLTECVNENCHPEHVWQVCTDILDRNYGKDGRGGFFPLKHSKKDQREVELWWQMQAYIRENYPF